jgi:hypothetical protein
MSVKNRNRRFASAAVLMAAMTMPALLSGCDEIADAQSSLCCGGFEVGADLSGVDFEAGIEFNALAQAVADFAGTAQAMVSGVGNACKAIAVDNGAAEDAVTTTDPAAATEEWCVMAVATLDAAISAGASISVSAQPPNCNISVSAQAKCEGSCDVDVSCEAELGDISVRCDPGKLSGKCSAMCTGKCEGSANLAVSCTGTCEGTCQGNCSGNCSVMGPMGRCNGECDAECDGECRGSCEATAMAGASCDAQCTGGCDVEVTAPKCKAELTPPSAECTGNVDCSASCEASASAKAECTPPSVEVVITGMVDATLESSLRLHLPQIFLTAKAQAEIMLGQIQALGELSASVAASGDLSVKAAACIIPIGATIETAVLNVESSVTASASIVTTVGG